MQKQQVKVPQKVNQTSDNPAQKPQINYIQKGTKEFSAFIWFLEENFKNPIQRLYAWNYGACATGTKR